MIAEGANEGGHGWAVTHSQTTGLNSFSSHVLLDVKFTRLAGSPGVCGSLHVLLWLIILLCGGNWKKEFLPDPWKEWQRSARGNILDGSKPAPPRSSTKSPTPAQPADGFLKRQRLKVIYRLSTKYSSSPYMIAANNSGFRNPLCSKLCEISFSSSAVLPWCDISKLIFLRDSKKDLSRLWKLLTRR